MEQENFKEFMRKSFEFYSRVRAAEKERFEVMQQFMIQTAELLQELTKNVNNAIVSITQKIDELHDVIFDGLETIKKSLGVNNLDKIHITLQDILDKIQRHSYMIEYKEILKDLKNTLGTLRNMNKENKEMPHYNNSEPSKFPRRIEKRQLKSSPVIEHSKRNLKTIYNGKIKTAKNHSYSSKDEISSDNGVMPDEDIPTFLRVEMKKSSDNSSTNSEEYEQQPRKLVQLKHIEPNNDDDK
ncbi:MAG: hypothetical protein ACTSRP_02495 [Candidatus Helarchaeota archaeon]